MTGGVLVVGGDAQGVQAALDLADCGIGVTLVEESPSLRTADDGESLLLMPKLLRAASHPGISVLTGTTVAKVRGARHDFRVSLTRQPRYVRSTCTSCARCENACPVNVFSPSGTDGRKAVHRPVHGLKSVPSTYVIEKRGVPPCTAACPAGVNVQGYVSLVAEGKLTEAFNLITEAVAFPRVLGRVCTHPCETACTRGKVDHPVAICALKRFASNGGLALNRGWTLALPGLPQTAIIGAGPAGLTAAYDLARMGHRATVFEALPVPGGMITVGMPRFRLPREVRQADIADIVRLGIEIRTSTPVGPGLTLDDLRRKGYRAILIAVGAHRNQRLGIAGEGLPGVMDSIALLQALNLKQPVSIGRRVVVVGGGYTGIDSARTAIRLHCERVLVVDRCAREDLAANPEEIAEAEEEGVEFEYLVAPVRIVGKDGRVAGVEFRRMKPGEGDGSARLHTTPIEGSEFFVEADTVIVAAGQRPDLSFLDSDTTLTEGKRHIIVDPVTQATKVPGIFAAGDAAAASGPMVNAIAAGRRAATSINRFLRGEALESGRAPARVVPVEVDLDKMYVPKIERQPMPYLEYGKRTGGFEEVDLGFTPETAVQEARRCLSCAVCSDCRECQRACEVDAIDHDAARQEMDIRVSAIVTGKGAAAVLDSLAGTRGIFHLDSDMGLSSASAVAGQVVAELKAEQEPALQQVEIRQAGSQELEAREPRLGVFVCDCGGEIGKTIDIPDILGHWNGKNGVVTAEQVAYACTGDAARHIRDTVAERELTHAVIAACACCNLDQICFSCSDRRLQCKSNLLSEMDGTRYEFVNIREHCAWVHSQAREATAKARDIIGTGLARARLGTPPLHRSLGVERSAVVLGGGAGGARAAMDLAAQGFPTVLVGDGPAQDAELAGKGVVVIKGARVADVLGTAGGYRVSLARDGKTRQLTAGAIVLDASAIGPELPSLLAAAVQGSNSARLEPVLSRLPGIFLCGTQDAGEAEVQGSAAAVKASALLHRGQVEVVQTVAVVDPKRCRACGTCESVCPSGAVAVSVTADARAQVNEWLCQGCGTCVAHCPSGALSQSGDTDSQISATLEAALS